MTPSAAREYFRIHRHPTAGYAPGYAQANLICLPKEDAFDFLLFAHRNPKPCPLLGVLEPGEYTAGLLSGSDIRDCLPAYRVFRNGSLIDEPSDVHQY